MILSAADGVQHFADGLHGLGQILHNLHIQIPPKLSAKSFVFLPGAMCRSTKRDGIIALVFSFRKA